MAVSMMRRWAALTNMRAMKHAPRTAEFRPVEQIRRTGVHVRVDDVELFAWEPRANRITVGAHLTEVEKRCALALAMAHRALGHIGNNHLQDIEARLLGQQWLIPDTALTHAINTVGNDVEAVAGYLAVSALVLRSHLGMVCLHVTNIEAFRQIPCTCMRSAA